MSELALDDLPPLPQAGTIRTLAGRLWRDERVVALWLGGSIARGAGDPYSDIDLRIAVRPDDLADWTAPDLDALAGGMVVGRQFMRFGEGMLLHHVALRNGDVVDLLAQSTERAPFAEPLLIFGCRDARMAEALVASNRQPEEAGTPISGTAIRELIVDFWINSHKHRKVLHRGLDLMIPSGLQGERMMLMRLWFIQATGQDTSAQHFQGIHGLTSVVAAIMGMEGEQAQAILGAPVRTREEVFAAIERHREVVARVGRALTGTYGFEYPEVTEEMVVGCWEAFRQEEAGR